ncbi:hypothetical protein DFH09DRAFT_1394623 [Mycena vulgaris]|nr:hypothetical protein DFH09DRAFT_1394623 [Mycena vulgaris]
MDHEPPFPVELEREIFETAAIMYPKIIPVLLRVSRRVLIWIEPLLYRVIRLDPSRGPRGGALRRAMQVKPAGFFRDNVRHVALFTVWEPEEDLYDLLRICPRLLSLACPPTLSTPALLPILQEMKGVRKFSCDLEFLFGYGAAVNLRHSFFRTITHMDMPDVLGNGNGIQVATSLAEGLAEMPALTHLALHDLVGGTTFLQRVLDGCAHLRAVVTLVNNAEWWRARKIADNPPVTDARFLVCTRPIYWDDWEVGARGGTDFWAAADTFLARKRRGEIEGSDGPKALKIDPQNF